MERIEHASQTLAQCLGCYNDASPYLSAMCETCFGLWKSNTDKHTKRARTALEGLITDVKEHEGGAL